MSVSTTQGEAPYTLCVCTGTRDVAAAVTAARHQLARPDLSDDSLPAS
ncbi:DUF5133 domain-containing protein [Streptomyces fildesensis]